MPSYLPSSYLIYIKCVGLQTSWALNVLGFKCLGSQMSASLNVFGIKCLGIKISCLKDISMSLIIVGPGLIASYNVEPYNVLLLGG